jgi:putative spermidine/putrescine transport system ATP-binding protein
MAGLSIEHLSKELGGRLVVDDLSLSVGTGELVCLLGPSGCGKTTTLRMIGGFEQQVGGTIVLDGAELSGLAPERRPTAMVFQHYALWPHMSVFKNVAFGLKLRKMPRPVIEERVMGALSLVNLGHLRDRKPGQLSGGERQRVALARALVLEPKLLLLDEPLSNLDARLRVQVREEIREIQQRLQIATVFVTHDQDEALSISDRIAVMSGGRIEQFADADALYRRPATGFVAGFIGAMNLFPGRVVEGGVVTGPLATFIPVLGRSAGPAGTGDEGARPGEAHGGSLGPTANGSDPGAELLELAVRPEDVVVDISPSATGAHARHAGVPARARKVVPHGHFKEVLLVTDGTETEVRAFVAPEMDIAGELRVAFSRVLCYRDGVLQHELSAQRATTPPSTATTTRATAAATAQAQRP